MPSQLRNFVWGVDSIGRMHTLSTISQHWDLRSHGTDGQLLDFKQVTATKYSVWAIGCDQELYVYVHSGDVPIRCLEYTYENQVRNFIFAPSPPKKNTSENVNVIIVLCSPNLGHQILYSYT